MIHSLVFRLLSMAGKFYFLFVAVSYLSPQDVSKFGAFNSIAILACYLISADLYIQTVRSLEKESNNLFNTNLSNQIVFITFAVITLAIITNFLQMLSVVRVSWLFLTIILFDILAQESYRLLLALGKFRFANFIFFIKSGCWCFVAGLLIQMGLITSLETVLYVWVFFGIVSSLLGLSPLFSYFDTFVFSPSFQHFSSSFKMNSTIFASSLSFLYLGNVDKIFLAWMQQNETVASYIFFSSLVGATITLSFTGLINPFLKMLVSPTLSDKDLRKILLKISLGGLFIFTVVSLSLIFYANTYMGVYDAPYLLDNVFLLYGLIGNMFFSIISLAPHYYLFSKRQDFIIAKISIFIVILQTILLFILYPIFDVYGVLGSLILSNFMIAFLKYWFVIKDGFSFYATK